jgi:hypothetical protein
MGRSQTKNSWARLATTLALSADERREIEAAADKIEAKGARYSEAAQRMINR